MEVPVMVGDIVEGEVVDISHEGGGIVKVNNFTIFLDSGLIGDAVKFEVTKVKKSYGMGKTLDIIKPSIHRIHPKCNVSDKCGGCQFQSFDYKAQLEGKKAKVENDLAKIAGLEGIKVNDTIGMDSPYRYRNNVQIPVAISKGKPLIGFYERGSYKIVDTETCILQEETGDKIIRILKQFIGNYNITVNRHLGIRTNKDSFRSISSTKTSIITKEIGTIGTSGVLTSLITKKISATSTSILTTTLTKKIGTVSTTCV